MPNGAVDGQQVNIPVPARLLDTEGRRRLSWPKNGHRSQEWESLEHLGTTVLEQLTPYSQEKLWCLYMQTGCLYPKPTQVGR